VDQSLLVLASPTSTGSKARIDKRQYEMGVRSMVWTKNPFVDDPLPYSFWISASAVRVSPPCPVYELISR
jgi:hypothetical protein